MTKFLERKVGLPDAVVDKLQTYYGLAIRRNVHDQTNMKNAIWAISYHKISTDENPPHDYCPKGPDTWCKYNKAHERGENHVPNDNIPPVVM